MITFPTNPTVGQEFVAGAKAWQWNGVAWDALAIANTQVTRAESAATRAEAAAAVSEEAAAFSDANPIVKGSADATKRIRFEVDGLSTNTTRVLTVPDKDGTIAFTEDAGAVVRVASVVPTAEVAFVDLPNVFTASYDHYLIVLADIATSTGNAASMRVITGGSNVEVGNVYGGGVALGTDMAINTTMMGVIAPGQPTRFQSTIRFQRGTVAYFDVTGISQTSGGLQAQRYAYMTTVTGITGIRISALTGNFLAAGSINVYAFSKP